MKKKGRKSKALVWGLLATAFLIVSGSAIYMYFSVIKPQEDLKTQIEENPPSGVTAELAAMIADTHERYNELTGFGNIDELDQDKSIILSKRVYKEAGEALDEGIVDKQLEKDMKTIHQLAKETSVNPNKEQVRRLHRYFHDLDIAVNRYEETNTIFGVTETLGKPQ